MVKMLINSNGKRVKFWQVRVERMTATATFGVVGAKARVKVTTFKHGHELVAYVVRKVDEKRRRGYRAVKVRGARS